MIGAGSGIHRGKIPQLARLFYPLAKELGWCELKLISLFGNSPIGKRRLKVEPFPRAIGRGHLVIDKVDHTGLRGRGKLVLGNENIDHGGHPPRFVIREKRPRPVIAGGKGVLHSEAADLVVDGKVFGKVLDTFGGPGLQMALQLAAPYGQVATINARAQYDLGQAHAKALTLHAVFVLLPLLNGIGREAFGQRLQQIAQQLDNGSLKPLAIEVFSSQDVVEVHRRYESEGAEKKLVIKADY